MFLYVVPIVFAIVLIPALCINALNRNDVDPSIQALSILVLAPFVYFIINAIRLHL